MKWISINSIARLKVALLLFFLLFLAIVLRLFYIQFFEYGSLSEKAKQNWDREIPFVAERGLITDREGTVLVTNELAPTIYFMPAQNKEIEDVAVKLSDLLGMSKENLLEQLQKKAYMTKIYPQGKNISNEVAKEISELNIPGIYVAVDYKRYYPHGTMLARLLGFTGTDYIGLSGIEYAYNDVLTSKTHAIRMYTDAKGKQLPHVQTEWLSGEEGATVQLTIDAEIQQVVERELSQAMIKHDADQALAIAVNPKNGEIVALSSYPTYDPSDFRTVGPEIYNRNLPVFMTYEPGSTFKIITLSAAIEEDVIDLHEEHFHDPGFALVEGARLRCWKREGHKDQTFLQVVENSCNPGFIEMGQRVGSEKLLDYIKAFGFGESTNSKIAGEAKGILFSEESFGPVEHATTSFGQGISVTPIQQVQAVAAAINGGLLYEPSIVKSIIDPETEEVIYEHEPVMKRQVISEETSAQVRGTLESVVANGSGRQAFRDGLRIGGKTGTAQKVENGRYKQNDYIVSFIGFAPADDPQLLVYVAIDNPKSNLQFGGVIAAPIVGNIIEEMATRYQIPQSTTQIERKYVWGDPLTIRNPDLIGKSVDEILQQHYPFQIQWYGTGSKVSEQLPKPDVLLLQDEILHLYLSD